jgi:molybdopterin/thiamine biosynthesis adenylyltransferase
VSERLSGYDRVRYLRQLVIPELGEGAQDKLRAARVLVVGAGGLGSPCLLYLAAAGVGRLGIVDFDVVELSNLQRQIIHTTDDIGRDKTVSAAEKITALNPEVEVVRHHVHLDGCTVEALIDPYDIVVTAVDNLPARFLLNDACVLARKTLVEGAILRFVGLVMTIKGGESACYRCLFPEPPAPGAALSPAEAGVFGPVPGVIGAIQATEVIKVLTGIGRSLTGRLLQYDALEMTFDEVAVSRDPACPVCGDHPVITSVRQSAESVAL